MENISIINEAGNFELKVSVKKMIDDTAPAYAVHEVCSECSSADGRVSRCKNKDCLTEFGDGKEVRKTFDKLKAGEQAEKTYSKKEIEACKNFAKDGIIIQAKVPKADFDKSMIRDTHYVVMQDLTAKTKKAFANLYSGLLAGTHVLRCVSGRTGKEKTVIISVEKLDGDNCMVMFTIANVLQRRPKPANWKPLLEVSKEMTDKVVNFIEQFPDPVEEVESKTNINFEKLQAGEQVIELQHTDEEADADSMFDEVKVAEKSDNRISETIKTSNPPKKKGN